MSTPTSHSPLTAQQRAAIKQILALGGDVFYELGTSEQVVETITFRGSRFTDEHVSLLEPFHHYELYGLGLVGSQLSSEGACRAIAYFPKLRSFTAMDVSLGDEIPTALATISRLSDVSLPNTKVTSAGLKYLAGLKSLATIDFSGTAVDDRGLESLAGLTNLKWVYLGKTSITSSGLRHLAKLQKLDTLLLNGTQTSDEGLKWLTELTNLKSLRLDDTHVTDAGLIYLKGLPRLNDLDLENTNVTDQGIKELQAMPMLREVRLKGTKVTELARDRLMLYLPANEKRSRKWREQFERGDWPPKAEQ